VNFLCHVYHLYEHFKGKGIAMKYYPVRAVMVITLAAMLVLIGMAGVAVTAQQPGAEFEAANVEITNPSEGDTVSGIITVTGTVDFSPFLKYEILLKSGKQLIWGATSFARIMDGNLARLDTKIFADGTYQLVVRQVNPDSNYKDFVGPAFTIENGLGAPQPFPEIESSFLYAPEDGALIRVSNCSGFNMEFDYVSPEGFCSSGNLWIMAKVEGQPLCTEEDVLVIPNCEYRGTIDTDNLETNALTYMLDTEPGKIYRIIYPGGERFFIGEVEGDDPTAPPDPGFSFGMMEGSEAAASPGANSSAATDSSAASSGSTAAPQPTSVPQQAPAAAPSDSSNASEVDEALLPISGRADVSSTPFAVAGAGLILFMVVGGLVAIVRGRRSVE
jgi:hypothetical protein